MVLRVADALRAYGWRVVGVQLYPDRCKWLGRIVVIARSGMAVAVKVRPPKSLEALKENGVVTAPLDVPPVKAPRWRRGLEGWERPLVAAAMYMVDSRPEDEVFGDMVELVEREEAERIAFLYTLFREAISLEELYTWCRRLEVDCTILER